MSSPKNIEIEYLRAAAILLTLVSHLPVLLPFHLPFFESLFSLYMPWSGVDLFFCISGYVVTRAYLDYFDHHRINNQFGLAVQCFWLRRLYRLLPTAWLWIFIPLLLSIAFNKAGHFGTWYENLRSFAAVATFSGNLANQFGELLGPNGVYWSLALEEQFYFLFPMFLFFVTKAKWRIAALFLGIAIQFPLDRNLFAPPPAGLLSSFRLDAMMWGILLALFSRSTLFRQFEPTALGSKSWARAAITLILLYLLGAIPGQLIGMPTAVGMIAIVSLLLVWLASYQRGYLLCPPACSKLLVWLGTRSYALYVIHTCGYRFSYEIWYRYADSTGVVLDRSYTVALVLTALFIIMLAAELNYRLIETPLRRKGAAIASRRLEQLATEGPHSMAPTTGAGTALQSGKGGAECANPTQTETLRSR